MALLHLRACVVDFDRGMICRDGEELSLTPNEAALLRYLAARPGELVDRREVDREVFGLAPRVRSHAAGIAVRRLRAKIEADPARPDHLHTLKSQGFRLDLPTASPVRGPADLVGRQGLWRTLLRRARRERWLTLVGPPGVGKTRLARSVHDLLDDRIPPTWVDLGAARSDDDVLLALSRALGIRSATASEVRLALGAAPRRLFLDGVEGVADAVRARLEAWLDGTALRAVVTSQGPLGGAEAVIEVPPLEVSAAVELLEARVRQVRPGWIASPAQRLELTHLAARLDGLPLAIELAAGRMAVIGPRGLAGRLLGGLDVLADPRAPDGLGAVLARSLDLLERGDLEVLHRCAAFVGAFPAVAIEDGARSGGALDALQRLVERGLVAPDGEQLRLLWTVRQIVRPRCDRAVLEWHAGWVIAATDGTWTHHLRLPDPDGDAERIGWAEDLQAVTRRDVAPGFRVAAAVNLARLLGQQGQQRRVEELLRELRVLGGAPALARRRGDLLWAQAATHLGRLDGVELVLRALIAEGAGDATEAEAWSSLGTLYAGARRDEEAWAAYDRAIAAGQAMDLPRLVLYAQRSQANLLLRQGQNEQAAELVQRVIDGFRAAGDPATADRFLTVLATAELRLGRTARAVAACRRAVAAAAEQGWGRVRGEALAHLAVALIDADELDEASRVLDEAYLLASELRDPGMGCAVELRRALLRMLAGAWAYAEQDLGGLVVRYEALGNSYGAEEARALRGVARWFLDDPGGARADFLVGERPEDLAYRAIGAAGAGEIREAEALLADAPACGPAEAVFLRLARCHVALARARTAPPDRAAELRSAVEAELEGTQGSSVSHRLGRAMLAEALSRFDRDAGCQPEGRPSVG